MGNYKDKNYKKKWYELNKLRILKDRKEKYAEMSEEKIAYQMKYAQTHKDEIKALKREIKLRPETRFRDGKWRAKNRGLSWTISFEEFKSLISTVCYYCSSDLSKSIGTSLDRINNSKGYDIDNILPCCSICNRGRNKFFTVAEWKIMVNALLAYRNL